MSIAFDSLMQMPLVIPTLNGMLRAFSVAAIVSTATTCVLGVPVHAVMPKSNMLTVPAADVFTFTLSSVPGPLLTG